MITREGRVVVLDFGLVSGFGADAGETVTRGRVAGTVAYMSPEQCVGDPLGPASDWYAVGVMMYQALTGKPPFSGTYLKVLVDKQSGAMRPPAQVAPEVPEDLDRLCMRLLRPDPADRPSAAEILATLGTAPSIAVALPPALAEADETAVFVNRAAELAALRDAHRSCTGGKTIIVELHGESGIGKSALTARFLEAIGRRENAVVLGGRCYEQEMVPYKVLDSLVDSLSRYLSRTKAGTIAGLIPRNITALVQVFPVLGRAEVVANAPGRSLEGVERREVRRRAFGALRELLIRLGDRHELALFIDDLRWGDAESAHLLMDVLRSPDGPSLLLICAYRREYASRSECLEALFPAGENAGFETREIAIEPLSDDDARLLASRLLFASPKGIVAAGIARESQGSPLLRSGAGAAHRGECRAGRAIHGADARLRHLDARVRAARRCAAAVGYRLPARAAPAARRCLPRCGDRTA